MPQMKGLYATFSSWNIAHSTLNIQHSTFNIQHSKKMKANTWKTILQIAISILTAIATTLGVTSCMG